jgi:hypothetical protein
VRKVTRIDGNNALQAFKPKVRVAAYCRVSTESDEQMASLETQMSHYESYIKANPDWEAPISSYISANTRVWAEVRTKGNCSCILSSRLL